MAASRRFEPRAAEVRAARRFAVGTAVSWGLDPSGVETVVGELAANAYAHARTPFTVRLGLNEESLLSIEVADESDTMPRAVHAPPDSLGGRGLVMVEAVAATWGVRRVDDGKVVWAELSPVSNASPQR